MLPPEDRNTVSMLLIYNPVNQLTMLVQDFIITFSTNPSLKSFEGHTPAVSVRSEGASLGCDQSAPSNKVKIPKAAANPRKRSGPSAESFPVTPPRRVKREPVSDTVLPAAQQDQLGSMNTTTYTSDSGESSTTEPESPGSLVPFRSDTPVSIIL